MSDFGLSCTKEETRISMAGAPGYMSPEMVNPSTPGYSHLTDYWSMGMCLYHLCTGSLPMPSAESTEVVVDDDDEEDCDYLANSQFELCLPSWFSPEGREFISELLDRNPTTRLGGESNPCRQHPWFKDMDWEALENHTLPLPKM